MGIGFQSGKMKAFWRKDIKAEFMRNKIRYTKTRDWGNLICKSEEF